MQGFKSASRAGNIVLGNGRTAVGQLQLQLGELTEVISVTAIGESLKTTTTAQQAVLDLKQVTNLSIRGRDPISLLKILPGVGLLANDQETFGGSFATAVPVIQGSIFKTFPMKGSQRMQFRWEIYNLFNSLQFNEVDTSAIFDANGNQTDTNFGKVISARNERRMQFSRRYTF